MTLNEKIKAQLVGKLRKRVLELDKDGARLNAMNMQGCAATMWKSAQMLRLVIEDLEK